VSQERLFTCACCEQRGPAAAIAWNEDDQHFLCVDQGACLGRFRQLAEKWRGRGGPRSLTVYDDSLEDPW
jgi:hypothetical protein